MEVYGDTYASVCNEVNNVDDFTGVGVDGGREPVVGALDLDDVGEGDVVGVTGKVLERGGVVVVLGVQVSLSLGDGLLCGELGSGGRNRLWDDS